MAKPILVANWKNNPKSLKEAKALLKQLAKSRDLYKRLSFFIAPPLTYFESVGEKAGSFFYLACQDVSLNSGAHTGEVSLDILKSFGVKLAILGHSERRSQGETEESIASKVAGTLAAGITPLICVGESIRDKDGEHFEVLREELKSSFSLLDKKADPSKAIVAYEPVWAIGKRADEALDPKDLAQAVIFIRKVLTDLFGRKVADKMLVLYGGSVESANAGRLLEDTGIRGFLVGHSSLDAADLKAIAEALLEKRK